MLAAIMLAAIHSMSLSICGLKHDNTKRRHRHDHTHFGVLGYLSHGPKFCIYTCLRPVSSPVSRLRTLSTQLCCKRYGHFLPRAMINRGPRWQHRSQTSPQRQGYIMRTSVKNCWPRHLKGASNPSAHTLRCGLH